MAIVIHQINGSFYAYEHYKENGKVVCVYLYPVESKEKLKLVKVEPGQSQYKGMNYYAAKELGIKYPYSENTIVVDKGSRKDEITTIRHEIAEREVMKHRGMKYEQAHEFANKAEKLDTPKHEGAGSYEKPYTPDKSGVNPRRGYTFRGERKPTYKGKKVLGTVKKGKVPITSQEQMDKMHAQEIDHTHFTFDESGNIESKKRHVY